MMEIEAMTDSEVFQEIGELQRIFTDQDFDRLENLLSLKAGCLGWTGNPLKQPPRSVLSCARQVVAESEA